MRLEKSRERLHTGPSQSNRVKRPFRLLHLSEVPTCDCNGRFPCFFRYTFPLTCGICGSNAPRARGEADLSSSSDKSFLRQPSRPNTPRPVAKSERAAGSGAATTSIVKL